MLQAAKLNGRRNRNNRINRGGAIGSGLIFASLVNGTEIHH